VLVTLFGLFAPPAVIWRPHGDSAPRELFPPCTPRYAPALVWTKSVRFLTILFL